MNDPTMLLATSSGILLQLEILKKKTEPLTLKRAKKALSLTKEGYSKYVNVDI